MKISGDRGGFFENNDKSTKFLLKNTYKLQCNGHGNENTGM
jgi:hypothetical protein